MGPQPRPEREVIFRHVFHEFSVFFRCVFGSVFRRRVFEWGPFSQSAPSQFDMVFTYDSDNSQGSRVAAKSKQKEISSEISMQKTEEIMFENSLKIDAKTQKI